MSFSAMVEVQFPEVCKDGRKLNRIDNLQKLPQGSSPNDGAGGPVLPEGSQDRNPLVGHAEAYIQS